jgi:hypothetical protein
VSDSSDILASLPGKCPAGIASGPGIFGFAMPEKV